MVRLFLGVKIFLRVRKKKWPFFELFVGKKVFKKYFLKLHPSSRLHLTIISEAFAFKRYRVNTVGGSYGFDRNVNSFELKKPNFLILAPWHESKIEIFENAWTFRFLLEKIELFFSCRSSDCFWGSSEKKMAIFRTFRGKKKFLKNSF